MPLDGSKLSPIATRMREIFGPNGEGWCQHRDRDGPRQCLVQAYSTALGASWIVTIAALDYAVAIAASTPNIQCMASRWNDAPERTYADICRVVDEIERMEIAGELR